MKFKVAVIEDDIVSQEIALDVLKNDPRVVVHPFMSPNEFLMKGGDFDLVISDWSFGHTNLGNFLKSFDRSKLIVYTGSFHIFDVECAAVLYKFEGHEKLLQAVDVVIRRSRFS